jgi:hypothetical protein
MSQTRIESLTPEQEALIPFYRQKWRPLPLSSGAIDREKAADTVKAAYSLMGKQEPEILFCDSSYAALTALQTDFYDQLDSKPRNELIGQLLIQLENHWKINWESNFKLSCGANSGVPCNTYRKESNSSIS